jgi:hypothetical protein
MARHGIKQDRPRRCGYRHDWFDGQLDADPERIVFIGQTLTATHMAGWASRTAIARSPRWSRACA